MAVRNNTENLPKDQEDPGAVDDPVDSIQNHTATHDPPGRNGGSDSRGLVKSTVLGDGPVVDNKPTLRRGVTRRFKWRRNITPESLRRLRACLERLP